MTTNFCQAVMNTFHASSFMPVEVYKEGSGSRGFQAVEHGLLIGHYYAALRALVSAC